MKLFCGYFIHSLGLDELVIQSGIILVDEAGVIEEILNFDSVKDLQSSMETAIDGLKTIYNISEVYVLSPDQFLIPGFIDSHFHAPQVVNLGRGYDLPLLEWLNKYTFQREAKFRNVAYAKEVYMNLVKSMLKQGTTTVSYFATIHLEATKILADCMIKLGQRGYVGKVCMDRNAPDYYIESYQSCMSDNTELINYLSNSTLVGPIITPRFAITCTSRLLNGLGDLAEEYGLPIQSHLSENKKEIATVSELFPNRSYTQVYDDHKLLTERTVMAHCVHLTEDEIDLIKERNAGVSHCPASNVNLMSGLLDVKKLIERDIKVGLGSDVSGGNTCSILKAIINAISVSKSVNTNALNLTQAFYLATLGNAHVLNLEKKVGSFQVGKCFDALLIDTKARDSIMYIDEDDSIFDKFEKFIFSGDDRNIQKVYVNGRLVHSEKTHQH